MKTRSDFVTNSSSSSFVIINKTDKTYTPEEFIQELFGPAIKYLIESGTLGEIRPGRTLLNLSTEHSPEESAAYHLLCDAPWNNELEVERDYSY